MVINGKEIQKQILEEVRQGIKALPFAPVFSDVLIGNDPVSLQYVKMKARMADALGISFRHAHMSTSLSEAKIIEEIKKLNEIDKICGLIVQLPIPKGFNQENILNAVSPEIDVDATGAENSRLFYSGQPRFIFPTAAAVLTILDTLGLDLGSQRILVVGQGKLVGLPVTHLLRSRGLEVQILDLHTKNTEELLKKATVIISAVGKGKLITGDKISEGVTIIDAGTSESNGAIIGDVDFDSVKGKAQFISPVPGGVGPVTVAELFRNVLLSAKQKTKKI